MSRTFIWSLCSTVELAGKGSQPISIEKLQPHFLLSYCFIRLYFNGASRFNIERNCFLSGDICIHATKGACLQWPGISTYSCRWRFSTKMFFYRVAPERACLP